jgi:IclR family acetate operon transcriptional repressor
MTHPAIRNDQSKSTVLRSFNLLGMFTPRDLELTLSQLAARSGNPKTSTHRLVNDLVQCGALERTEQGYRLGVRLFELGHLVPIQRRIRDAALPFLQDLREISHLTTNLAVRDGMEVVYVEKLVSRETVVPHSRTGGRLPVHATALGKAMLAFESPEFIDDVLAHLRPLTSKTIVDPEQFRREIADIRNSRIAYDNEESQIGLFCVAAPILVGSSVAGAISVTGATQREQAHRFGPAVTAVTRALARALGQGTQDTSLL